MWLSILNNLFVFILGATVGSFLNVCIHRLPREESIVWPSSRCPLCHKAIRWYDNIPIVSVVLLKGRCRWCQGKISLRYLVIELLTAISFLWIWLHFGLTIQTLVAAVLFSLLLIATVVDLEHQIIPDEVSLGGLGAGIVLSTLIPSLQDETVWFRGFVQSLIGALVGGAVIYATGVIGKLIFRKEAMGGGDVKLLAMLGALLGWKKVLFVYLVAPFFALPVGLFVKFAKRTEIIPFGPFLSLAGWIAFLWADPILAWYWPAWSF